MINDNRWYIDMQPKVVKGPRPIHSAKRSVMRNNEVEFSILCAGRNRCTGTTKTKGENKWPINIHKWFIYRRKEWNLFEKCVSTDERTGTGGRTCIHFLPALLLRNRTAGYAHSRNSCLLKVQGYQCCCDHSYELCTLYNNSDDWNTERRSSRKTLFSSSYSSFTQFTWPWLIGTHFVSRVVKNSSLFAITVLHPLSLQLLFRILVRIHYPPFIWV